MYWVKNNRKFLVIHILSRNSPMFVPLSSPVYSEIQQKKKSYTPEHRSRRKENKPENILFCLCVVHKMKNPEKREIILNFIYDYCVYNVLPFHQASTYVHFVHIYILAQYKYGSFWIFFIYFLFSIWQLFYGCLKQ